MQQIKMLHDFKAVNEYFFLNDLDANNIVISCDKGLCFFFFEKWRTLQLDFPIAENINLLRKIFKF